MSERRQITRRDPIECELSDGRVLIAKPLPWLQANDLGQEILRQNAESTNEFVRLYATDEGLPQLELQFQKKILDWSKVLLLCFPESKITDFDNLSEDEAAGLVLASMEVNHLEHLRHLVDPNSLPPMLPGGIASVSGTEKTLGQKIESILESSDSASIEIPSSNLPEEKSSDS